jgi:hypothetical protein
MSKPDVRMRATCKKFKCNFFALWPFIIRPLSIDPFTLKLLDGKHLWTSVSLRMFLWALMNKYWRAYYLHRWLWDLYMSYVSSSPLIIGSYFKKRNCMRATSSEEHCWYSVNLNVNSVGIQISLLDLSIEGGVRLTKSINSLGMIEHVYMCFK